MANCVSVVDLYSAQSFSAASIVKLAFLTLESPSVAPPTTCIGSPVSGCVNPAKPLGVRSKSRCASACSRTYEQYVSASFAFCANAGPGATNTTSNTHFHGLRCIRLTSERIQNSNGLRPRKTVFDFAD